MWDLPRPGLEPVSPALAGGFLATAPPGKPPSWPFYLRHLSSVSDALAPWENSLGVAQNPQDAKAAFINSSKISIKACRCNSVPGIGELSVVHTIEGACILEHKTDNNCENKEMSETISKCLLLWRKRKWWCDREWTVGYFIYFLFFTLKIFFNLKNIYLFIYFWLRWVFVAARRLSLVAVRGGLLFVVEHGL